MKKSSQQIEDTIDDFLTQVNTQAVLAQIIQADKEISLDSSLSLHKELRSILEVGRMNKNANRKGRVNNLPLISNELDSKTGTDAHSINNQMQLKPILKGYRGKLIRFR
ncbi:hypothetical protein [Candidatus Williamhamiltonella defendens]|uniref:hypothetical protein n=1 Tax=Candidatus Williamhamiltonella defendens TaxID=138072 RepID=UPI00130DE0E4|nr:hypothetical protein [Candidatus Hamiltonella defensa]